MNVAKPPFDSTAARQALAYGVDRDTLDKIRNDGILRPRAAHSHRASTVTSPTPDCRTSNPKKAKASLAKYKADTGKDLTFTLTHTADPDTTPTAMLIHRLMEQRRREREREARRRSEPVASTPPSAGLPDGTFGGTTRVPTPTRSTCGGTATTPRQPAAVLRQPGQLRRLQRPAISTRTSTQARVTPTRRSARRCTRTINKEFAKQLYNAWAYYTLWTITVQPTVHGVLGPTSPTAAGRSGLASEGARPGTGRKGSS